MSISSIALSLFASLAPLDGFDVDVEGQGFAPDVRALELDVVSELPDGAERQLEDSCGRPAAVLIALSSSTMLIGESHHDARDLTSIAALHTALAHFKDARKDRVEAILQVDDDVDHARVVAVLDAIHGVDMYPQLVLSPMAPRFSVDDWRSPVVRGRVDHEAWRRAPRRVLTWLPERAQMFFRAVGPR